MIFLFCSHDAPYYILSILPLALFSVRSRPRLYFNPGLFILHPFQVRSPRCLVENRAFAPLFAADPGLYITGLGQAAPAFHFEKSARFPFHRKQLLLNIFIRRLIILSLRSSVSGPRRRYICNVDDSRSSMRKFLFARSPRPRGCIFRGYRFLFKNRARAV